MSTQYGAVSKEVALAMVKGGIANSKAQIAIAITGIAGPSGGTTEKPVGTVYMAFKFNCDTSCYKNYLSHILDEQSEIVIHKLFHGRRQEIRHQVVTYVLTCLIEFLQKDL